MFGGQVADELHYNDCLTHPSTTVGSYLPPLSEGGNQVNHLKSGLQHLGGGLLLLK